MTDRRHLQDRSPPASAPRACNANGDAITSDSDGPRHRDHGRDDRISSPVSSIGPVIEATSSETERIGTMAVNCAGVHKY